MSSDREKSQDDDHKVVESTALVIEDIYPVLRIRINLLKDKI